MKHLHSVNTKPTLANKTLLCLAPAWLFVVLTKKNLLFTPPTALWSVMIAQWDGSLFALSVAGVKLSQWDGSLSVPPVAQV